MSKYFTVRTPLVVAVGNQSHTFYIRELGYLQLMEITQALPAETDKENRGLAIMKAVCLAAIEEEDGTPCYDEASWRVELKDVVTTLAKAAMKAQHMDLEQLPTEPLTPEEAEGNAEPSRKSGANSRSTSAAQSVN